MSHALRLSPGRDERADSAEIVNDVLKDSGIKSGSARTNGIDPVSSVVGTASQSAASTDHPNSGRIRLTAERLWRLYPSRQSSTPASVSGSSHTALTDILSADSATVSKSPRVCLFPTAKTPAFPSLLPTLSASASTSPVSARIESAAPASYVNLHLQHRSSSASESRLASQAMSGLLSQQHPPFATAATPASQAMSSRTTIAHTRAARDALLDDSSDDEDDDDDESGVEEPDSNANFQFAVDEAEEDGEEEARHGARHPSHPSRFSDSSPARNAAISQSAAHADRHGHHNAITPTPVHRSNNSASSVSSTKQSAGVLSAIGTAYRGFVSSISSSSAASSASLFSASSSSSAATVVQANIHSTPSVVDVSTTSSSSSVASALSARAFGMHASNFHDDEEDEEHDDSFFQSPAMSNASASSSKTTTLPMSAPSSNSKVSSYAVLSRDDRQHQEQNSLAPHSHSRAFSWHSQSHLEQASASSEPNQHCPADANQWEATARDMLLRMHELSATLASGTLPHAAAKHESNAMRVEASKEEKMAFDASTIGVRAMMQSIWGLYFSAEI